MMANTGLLVLTNPTKVMKLLPMIKKHVLKTLYIQYFPEKNIFLSGNQMITNPQWQVSRYAQIVTDIYINTSTIFSPLDVRVLLTICSKREADTFIQDYLANTSMGCSFINFTDDLKSGTSDSITSCANEEKTYKNVVLGGTFDRIHNGHKIILSEAALRCTEKLTVGVTDTNMLSAKLLWELIEPCSIRILNLKDFLEDIDPTITYEVIAINDMYGPTKCDSTFEMIVVSEETKRGGDKVNEMREKNNLNKLDIHVVKLINDENHKKHEESKVSSSNQRIRLLGTKLKAPQIGNKPLKPYIIGLTGGIASGKSSVAEKLQKLGAALVNCDKIAHDLYLPGKKCFDMIIENFGPTILKPDGSIDRRALGNIVFNDHTQLSKLNKIVWPIILEEAKKQIYDFNTKGFDVIVMEAAVLIQAKWQHECHEIWTCIIPQEEAIRRIAERNGLTEADAKVRIQAQPSNVEQIKEANVVICSLWSHNITEEQVQRAWNESMTFLTNQAKN